jgi:hypothetical protein
MRDLTIRAGKIVRVEWLEATRGKPSKGIIPACSRCGSSAAGGDEDGDLYCLACGRVREAA